MVIPLYVGYLPEVRKKKGWPVSCRHNLCIFIVHYLSNIAEGGVIDNSGYVCHAINFCLLEVV